MTRPRAALAAALLFGLAAPASAQPPADVLALVPPDAAVFAHVDVAKVMKGKVGDAIRNLELPNEADPFDPKPAGSPKSIKPYGAFAKQLKDATGVDLETITSATFYIPKVKGPGDESTFVLALTLPAYDQAKVLAGLGTLNEQFKNFKMVGPGVVEFANGNGRIGFPSDTRILLMGNRVTQLPGAKTGTGAVTPALDAAKAGTAAAVVALNFANFPEEIKGDDLPNELRPFAPLIKSDLNYATFDVIGDAIKATVRVRNDSKPKTNDAEKALDNLRTFARTGLAVAQVQLQNEKDPSLVPFVKLVAFLQAAVKTAKIEADDAEARLTVSVPSDTPFAEALLAGLQGVRGASTRSVTANNLKQIGLAMHNYHDSMGTLPPAAICDKSGKPLLSWRVAILPYLEQDNLYKQFKLDEPWDSDHNKKLYDQYKIKVFTIPGEGAAGLTRFRVFTGGKDKVEAAFGPTKGVRLQDFTDGTSNTALVVTAKDAVPWTKPDELNFDPKGNPGQQLYFQNNVTPMAFGDGSVRYLPKSIPTETWRGLVSRNGGEVVNIP
jgi:hypothetical protein